MLDDLRSAIVVHLDGARAAPVKRCAARGRIPRRCGPAPLDSVSRALFCVVETGIPIAVPFLMSGCIGDRFIRQI